jgi:hypothetical protein
MKAIFSPLAQRLDQRVDAVADDAKDMGDTPSHERLYDDVGCIGSSARLAAGCEAMSAATSDAGAAAATRDAPVSAAPATASCNTCRRPNPPEDSIGPMRPASIPLMLTANGKA